MNTHGTKTILTKTCSLIGRMASILFLCLLLAPIQRVQAAEPAPTKVDIVQVAPNPAYIEQPVRFDVRVAALNPADGIPTGMVELRLRDNRVCLIALDAAGEGGCDLSFDDPATIPFKAVFLGTDRFLPSVSETTNLVVKDKHTPVFDITAHLPDPSVKAQPIDVSVRLTSTGPTPTGDVTVWRSNTTCTAPPAATATDRCTAGLTNGLGTCSLDVSVTGEISLCAAYGGDTATYAAQAEPVDHFVSSSNTYTAITDIDPSPSVLGETVWVSFEVGSPLGVGSPTDLVMVTSGSLSCTATVAEGRCALTFNTPHLHEVYAAYQGGVPQQQLTQMPLDNGFVLEPSTSRAVIHRVNAPPIDITLSNNRLSVHTTAGSEIADLSAVDPNPDETHTFSLVDGAGSTHNSAFRIDGDRLVLVGRVPSSQANLSIRIRAMDPAGLIFEKAFTLWVSSDAVLPATGFAPSRTTQLLPQPPEKRYQKLGEVLLEIPSLNLQAEITGVPHSLEDGWDTTWLWNRIGWLNGTAFPTWRGNSVLAGHNYLPSGDAGPFAQLHRLRWGDRVLVHAFGETHIFEVRSVDIVRPEETAALGHEESPWLTLVTCKSFDEKSGIYRWRVVVRAEWVGVQ